MRVHSIALLFLISIITTSCGGGGGGGSSSPEPVLIANIDLSGSPDGPAPLTLTFDGSGSSIQNARSDGPTITSYQWDFGDGQTDTGALVTHIYTGDQRYTATLTVTDSRNVTDTTQVTIRTAFSVSGTISATNNSRVDVDVNDPSRQDKTNASTTFITNNIFDDAQRLPNPTILNGFISRDPAGAPSSGNSNFEFDADFNDYYAVYLLENQFVSLRIADFNPSFPTAVDVDLYLYDSDLVLIGASNASNSPLESVSTLTEGEYLIQVNAFAGISKYVLNVGTTSMVTGHRAYGQKADFIPGEIIVKQKPLHKISVQAANTLTPLKLSHQDRSRPGLMRFDTASTPTKNVQTTSVLTNTINTKNELAHNTLRKIKELQLRDDVEYAEPNYRVYPSLEPNDTFYPLQTHYAQINLPLAWEITTGTPISGDVIVAVVDSGVVLNHEDLTGKLVGGYDFIRDPAVSNDGDGIDSNPFDPGDGSGGKAPSWHGTHVAGTIAANSNNGLGVSGVSWGAQIMPIRALGIDGGSSYDVMQGIRFAAGLSNDSGTIPPQPADIINLSLGGGSFNQSEQNLFTQLYNAGVIVVAAAGNENTSMPSYPAAYDNVISVSAVDWNNDKAPYSNFGSTIDITAPGGDLSFDSDGNGYSDGVLSTLVDTNQQDNYQFYQGTSMATPHVAGVAALMKAIDSGLTAIEFDQALQTQALTNDIGDSGRDDQFGFGIIDALKAVQHAQTLAGGTVTGSMLATPTRINFGNSLTSNSLTLTQIGNTPPTVSSFNFSAPWLFVDDSSVAANGTGEYIIQIDRSDLSDATYSDNIIFNLSNGVELTIPVTMTVQNDTAGTGDAGFLYVVLLDPESFDVVEQFNVDVQDGIYNYQFNNVPYGSYVIYTGSDVDNDFFICGIGESCGSYPTLDRSSTVDVFDDVSGLNFLAPITTDALSTSSTGTVKDAGSIERKAIIDPTAKTGKKLQIEN